MASAPALRAARRASAAVSVVDEVIAASVPGLLVFFKSETLDKGLPIACLFLTDTSKFCIIEVVCSVALSDEISTSVKDQIRELADHYARELNQQIAARAQEMKRDDVGHYLVYRVLGISADEGQRIDIYH